MNDKQVPSEANRRRRLLSLRTAAVLAAAGLLTACGALQGRPPEPSRVSAEGASEEFPNLAEVPGSPPPHSAPEDRQEVMAELAEDRAAATFTETEPLKTAAPRDPFASSLIISGDSVTSSDQVAGLPLPTAAGSGQLAAIIFFSHGSADLDPRDRDVLRDIAALQRERGAGLRVVGHASSRTHNATLDDHRLANFEMSLNRANTVLEELLRLGVPAAAAHAEAVGDAEPVYHEFMPSGEAGNRRVEIFLEN